MYRTVSTLLFLALFAGTALSSCSSWNGAAIASGTQIQLYSSSNGYIVVKSESLGSGIVGLQYGATATSATTFTLNSVSGSVYIEGEESGSWTGFYGNLVGGGYTFNSDWGGNFLVPSNAGGSDGAVWSFGIAVTTAPYFQPLAVQTNWAPDYYAWPLGPSSINGYTLVDLDVASTFELLICA
jgi:hypothetical protein